MSSRLNRVWSNFVIKIDKGDAEETEFFEVFTGINVDVKIGHHINIDCKEKMV